MAGGQEGFNNMRISGKNKGSDEDLLLQEVAFIGNIDELDKIIAFLTETRNDLVQTPNFSHDNILNLGEDTIAPHRHIQLRDKTWAKNNPDIAVYIPFKARKTGDGKVIWEDMELF